MLSFVLTYALVATVALFPIVAPSLPKTLPITWTESPDKALKAGEVTQLFYVKLISPCSAAFYDPKIVQETQEEFMAWCEKQFQENYVQPLEKMCRPSFAGAATAAGSKHRSKRAIGFNLRPIPVYVDVFCVTPLLGSWRWADRTLWSRMNDISNEIQLTKSQAKYKQTQLEKQVVQLRKAVQEFEGRLNRTEVDIEMIQRWRTDFVSQLPRTVTLTVELTTQFTRARDHLTAVGRDWANGRLSLHLFDAFMMGGNSSVIDIYRDSVPLECHFDARHSLVSFQFIKNVTEVGVKVYRANPFTFHKLIPGSELGYKLEYVGPREIAYESLSNCLVPYSSEDTSRLIRFPFADDCLPLNASSLYKYWRKTCEPMYYVDHTAIQVRAVDNEWYIYCEGFSVHVYKQLLPCPPYVFSVHSNETFEILTGQRIAKQLRPLNFRASDVLYSRKVGHHLMPRLNELDIDTFPLSANCPTSFTVTGSENAIRVEVLESGVLAVGVGLVVLLAVFAVFAAVVLVYIRRLAMHNRRKPSHSNGNGGLEGGFLALQQAPMPDGMIYTQK